MQKLVMGQTEYAGLAQITRQLRFLRLLKGPPIERMLARIELCSYDKGETIFHKGDPPAAFYLIYQGRIRIHLGYRLAGLVKKIVHLGPGDLFGEKAIVEKRRHSATAVAAEASQLFVLTYEQFDELMRDDADFGELIKFVMNLRK